MNYYCNRCKEQLFTLYDDNENDWCKYIWKCGRCHTVCKTPYLQKTFDALAKLSSLDSAKHYLKETTHSEFEQHYLLDQLVLTYNFK